MKQSKIFWALCLLLALSLFLASFVTNELWLSLCAGVLATVTYFKGDAILFSRANRRRANRRKELQQMFDARRKKHD